MVARQIIDPSGREFRSTRQRLDAIFVVSEGCYALRSHMHIVCWFVLGIAGVPSRAIGDGKLF